MPDTKRKIDFIEKWELWIKEPPLLFLSFDKGKNWEIKKLPFFPFYVSDKDVSFIFYKKRIPQAEFSLTGKG